MTKSLNALITCKQVISKLFTIRNKTIMKLEAIRPMSFSGELVAKTHRIRLPLPLRRHIPVVLHCRWLRRLESCYHGFPRIQAGEEAINFNKVHVQDQFLFQYRILKWGCRR